MEKIRRRLPRKRTLVLLALVALTSLAAKAWHDTMRDPVVERTTVALRGLPHGSPPLRIAFISDIHVAGPDMPPERLARIVAQINALEPDLVLIAGDLVSDKRTATHIYTPEEIVAPLGDLAAPLGVIAVPGNHDHWFDMPGIAAELDRRGITLLANEAVALGPLAIGGLDDDYTGRADVRATLAEMASWTARGSCSATVRTRSPAFPIRFRWCWPGTPIAARSATRGAARRRPCRTTASATPAGGSTNTARYW